MPFYFLTFSAYGARLHGQGATVDHSRNLRGSPRQPQSCARLAYQRSLMKHSARPFDKRERESVRNAICAVCLHREWRLIALHVRTTHVHVVVEANDVPEKLMSDFKAYATRALRAEGLRPPGHRVWARHGSTLWLFHQSELSRAVDYVLSGQGWPMQVAGEATVGGWGPNGSHERERVADGPSEE